MAAPKHAKDTMRGTIKLSDFKPSNLHPKAKFRICMALLGTFLLVFWCIYMLSSTPITFSPDINTSAGLAAMFRNLMALGYIIATIIIIIILWFLMIKDCPISPAAKWNYISSHDKSEKGVKLVAAVAGAVASKGSSSSINAVASALDDYFEETSDEKEKQMVNPKIMKK